MKQNSLNPCEICGYAFERHSMVGNHCPMEPNTWSKNQFKRSTSNSVAIPTQPKEETIAEKIESLISDKPSGWKNKAKERLGKEETQEELFDEIGSYAVGKEFKFYSNVMKILKQKFTVIRN
jgi:hypothetical protein